MRSLKSKFSMAAFAVLAVAVFAGSAGAQSGRSRDRDRDRDRDERKILEWQGQVDHEIRIQIDNRRASVIEVGRNERSRRRVNMVNAIPNRPGELYVRVLQGRGRVDVIQQPNARNGYTAVIRLRDTDGGSSRYRIEAYWDGDRWDNNGRRR